MMKKILGLDPGIGRTGYAIVYKENNVMIPETYGCIETSSKELLEVRLKKLHVSLTKIIKKHKPSIMVLERLFFNNNQKTAMVVGQAQGVMLLCAAENNLSVDFLTPLQIKQTLTGYGAADKKQVLKMVMMILELKTAPKLDDTVDAIACALSYLYQNSMLQ